MCIRDSAERASSSLQLICGLVLSCEESSSLGMVSTAVLSSNGRALLARSAAAIGSPPSPAKSEWTARTARPCSMANSGHAEEDVWVSDDSAPTCDDSSEINVSDSTRRSTPR
eukprot:5589798-Prymnesium_polylepis.1